MNEKKQRIRLVYRWGTDYRKSDRNLPLSVGDYPPRERVRSQERRDEKGKRTHRVPVNPDTSFEKRCVRLLSKKGGWVKNTITQDPLKSDVQGGRTP